MSIVFVIVKKKKISRETYIRDINLGALTKKYYKWFYNSGLIQSLSRDSIRRKNVFHIHLCVFVCNWYFDLAILMIIIFGNWLKLLVELFNSQKKLRTQHFVIPQIVPIQLNLGLFECVVQRMLSPNCNLISLLGVYV